MDDIVYEDPYCNPEKPVKLVFQDITSAAYTIRDGIIQSPCTVSIPIYSMHNINCLVLFLINCLMRLITIDATNQ